MRIAIVLATILFLGSLVQQAKADDTLPEGLRGFSGQVRGVVVAKADNNTFTFKVGRVLRVWKNNKAETPEALVGLTVSVGPRWVKGEDGKWRPNERHIAFIRLLEAGQELTLELQNGDGANFNILELSAEQRELVANEREQGDRPTDRETGGDEALPEGLRGFSGQVRGVVVAKGDNNTFTFKVGRVLRVWKGNKAKTPEALVGLTVRVGPRWVKGEDGKWHPNERHVAFIRLLEAGQELTLELQNVEGAHFSILELSAEQRELVANKAEKREQPVDRKENAERDRPADRKAEAEVRELEAEVKRLRAEVAELQRLKEEVKQLRAEVAELQGMKAEMAELRRLLKEKNE